MIPYWRIFGRLGNNLFQGAYIYAQMRKGLIPDIYVQDFAYFDEYRNEIREMFGQGITPIDKVGIHIRRGDYIGNPFYVDLTQTDYYEKAMALFPNEHFIVFSDDIEWCIENFMPIEADYEFSEGKTDVEDLNLLAGCKGIVMANSSFSFWASYLSNAKVIAPKAWHPDGVERTKCPKQWIRI